MMRIHEECFEDENDVLTINSSYITDYNFVHQTHVSLTDNSQATLESNKVNQVRSRRALTTTNSERVCEIQLWKSSPGVGNH